MNSCVGQRHGRVSAWPFDPVILDLEGDAGRIGADQPAVGDGDAVGVAGQISEHRLRPGKGAFGVDEPPLPPAAAPGI